MCCCRSDLGIGDADLDEWDPDELLVPRTWGLRRSASTPVALAQHGPVLLLLWLAVCGAAAVAAVCCPACRLRGSLKQLAGACSPALRALPLWPALLLHLSITLPRPHLPQQARR